MRRARRIAIALLVAAVATTNIEAQRAADATRAQDPVAAALDSLHRDANGLSLARSAISESVHTVEAGQHITGDVGSWHGPLEIRGTVDGNAVAIGSDVVLLAGGAVDGESRSISAFTVGPITGVRLTPEQALRRSLSLAVACYLILIAMAL